MRFITHNFILYGPQDEDQNLDRADPTHYSQLDLKTMSIISLKKELNARNSSIKGLKAQLAARLGKLIKAEKDNDETKNTVRESESGISQMEKKEVKIVNNNLLKKGSQNEI